MNTNLPALVYTRNGHFPAASRQRSEEIKALIHIEHAVKNQVGKLGQKKLRELLNYLTKMKEEV